MKKINSIVLKIIICCLFLIIKGDSLIAEEITIIPEPREIISKGFNVSISGGWEIITDKHNNEILSNARYLQEELLKHFALSLKVERRITLAKQKEIILCDVEDSITRKLINNIGLKLHGIGEEGYILEVFDDYIVIIGNEPQGVFYGIQSLLQLVKKEGNVVLVSSVAIKDYPEESLRGVHLATLDFGEIKKQLNLMARLKMNTVIIKTWKYYALNDQDNCEKLQEIFSYARERYIEPIPDVVQFGVGIDILTRDPYTAEGIYVYNEAFEFKDNVAYPVLNSKIDIVNPGFENRIDSWQFGQNWRIDIDSYTGKYSAKISVDGLHSIRSDVLKSRNYYVMPNSIYSLSFHAKVKNIGGDNPPALRVVELDSEEKFIRQHSIDIKETSWHRLELNFKTDPQCSIIYIYGNIWDGYGQAWIDNISLKRMDSALVNIIRTQNTDIVVKSADNIAVYKESEDYDVIDGEIKYPYFSNNKPTKIKRIPSGRIEKKEKVLVSYDYVVKMTPSSRWSIPYCPFEPDTYKIIRGALRDVFDSLQPKFISIGHDEIRGLNRDSRCKRQNLTNAEILAHDINKLYKIIKDFNSEVKILMWDDMLNPWHNGGDENYQVQYGGVPGKTSLAISLIPKDIVMMSWGYSADDRLGKMKNSPNYFESKGFNYLVASYKDKKNIENWIKIIKNKKECLGIIVTTWDGWDKNLEAIEYTARCSWSN